MLIKKMYLKLFNFMNGRNNNRFYKFMIHCFTVLLFFTPFVWLRSLIFTLTVVETVEVRNIIITALIFPLIVIAFPFIVKIMFEISDK